jgi:hypothetical protein
MGANASLLEYLPTDRIRMATFEDKKKQRPNALPIRMLFGQIKEGEHKGLEVYILLHKANTSDQSPQQRCNIFNRHGELVAGLTTEDAVRLSACVFAFKCLKESGNIGRGKLRAVIKYYFMLKNAEPPLPWPIDTQFIEDLIAACKVARDSAA